MENFVRTTNIKYQGTTNFCLIYFLSQQNNNNTKSCKRKSNDLRKYQIKRFQTNEPLNETKPSHLLLLENHLSILGQMNVFVKFLRLRRIYKALAIFEKLLLTMDFAVIAIASEVMRLFQTSMLIDQALNQLSRTSIEKPQMREQCLKHHMKHLLQRR